MGPLLPNTEAEVTSQIKWLTYLQGGGLSLLISVFGLSFSGVLFYTLVSNMTEDRSQLKQEIQTQREQDKLFRDKQLEATIAHINVTAQQTATQTKTNEILEEVKDGFSDLADKIEKLADNEQHSAERLDRMLEKAWNNVKENPQSSIPK